MARRKHLKLKILSFAMAAALLSGCAHRAATDPTPMTTYVKKTQTEETVVEQDDTIVEETFYESKDILLKAPEPAGHEGQILDYYSVSQPQFVGNYVMVSMNYTYQDATNIEEGSSEDFWAIFDLNGNYLSKIDNVYLPVDTFFAEDSNGDIVAAFNRYDDINGYWENSLYVARFAPDGMQLCAPALIMRGDYAFPTAVAASDQYKTLVSTTHDLFQLDQYGTILNMIDLDYTRTITGILQEGGSYYLMVTITEYKDTESCGLYRILTDSNGNFQTAPINRNADSLLGMKVYQNPERLYSATRNALGKLDIANGEFSRLLDWNQTDLDRSLLLNGNVKVISEGELSQTVTMLPQGDQPQLERPLPVVEQPSRAPDIESRPVPSAVGEDAPSDSSSAPEDFIDDPTLPESSSSADAVETQAAEPSDAKTKFYISNVEYTDLGCEAHLIKLEPAASNPHSGQDIVWVGGVGITDSMIMSKIADYNRNTSHDIWVKVVDYADFRYNGSFETRKYSTKAMESMLAQVNSGVGPDVIIGAGETGEFDNNNTLSDLNAYVDGINGINRDQYFDNAFRAFEMNGKLYQIPLGFATHALVGNPTLVDGKTEMNYHDFSSSSVFLDDDTKLLKGFSTETLLNILVEGETGTWINYATGEVSIDRSSLIDLLELLRFQKQSNSKLRYELSEDFEAELDPFQFDGIGSVYEGSGAFCPGSINSVTEYAMAKVREQETRWYGYPGSAGCATLIESPMTAGIAAYSTQKEKAWEVIKYLLSTEVQVDINSVPLMNSYFPRAVVPVNIEAFRKLNRMEKTDERVTEYIYSDSDLVYELDVGSFDDLLTEYEAMLKEPFRRYIHDDGVLTIVREVADEYLEGQITVTDAADTIVKRIMKLYEG